jgi:hyperosmotically inducible protein
MKPLHALLSVCAAVVVLSMAACQKEGPAERAGKAIDQSAEKVGEKVENATDKAGEALERAGDKIKEKTEQ